MGFPTFNLIIPANFTLAFGIYASQVFLGEQTFRGALHYGPIPTFSETEPSLEIFVLDFFSHTPVNSLSFSVGPYLREIKKFNSPEELQLAIGQDVAQIKKLYPA